MPYLKKQSKRPSGGKRRPYKKRQAKAGLKQTIQRMISRTQETKTCSISLPTTAFNSGISAISELYAIVPALAQGAGQTGRIGETVCPQKIVVRGYINYRANTQQSANEIISRLFCFQDKSVRSYDLIANVNLKLLDNGGAGSNFTGTLANMCSPHNNDHFTFYADRKHTFLKPFGYSNNGVLTTAITSMNASLVYFFTITLTKKHLPAYFKYDGSDYPTNFCPFIALGYASAQDDAPDTVNTQINMSYTSTLYYKDA